MSLSYKEVAEILKIIDASCCEEVVLELENTRLVVRRGGGGGGATNGIDSLPPKAESIASTPAKQTRTSPATSVATESLPSSDDSNMTVRSPMTGTCYCRPSPDDAPFVEEGATITSGDTLCLIEVMKLYTTIEASADGIVESILVEDGKLVDFDQPLFVIRSHGC